MTVPTPTGFQARYAGGGHVDLSWNDPGGLYQYEVRHADWGDVAAGWSRPVSVWDSPCSGGSADDCATDHASTSFLAPGHTYVYQLAAWNWAGGSDGGFDYPRAFVTLPAKLTGATSKLCATGGSGSGELVLRACAPKSTDQEWRYTATGRDGGYAESAIAGMGTGQCLLPAGRTAGAAVTQGSCTAAGAGTWEFRISDSHYDFGLYSKSTGLCLRPASGGSGSSGTRLVQARCSTSRGALWHSSLDY
jgi:hypothetical protein